MIAKADRLRIRMLSYASRLLVLGLNNKAAGVSSVNNIEDQAWLTRVGLREVEIARELLEILNDTKEVPSVRHRRHL